jgi:O-antigen ligase
MAHINISEPLVADWIQERRAPAGSAAPAERQPVLKRARGFALPVGLTASFLFLQMFDYHALGMSTVTPDRIIFLIIFGSFVVALRKGQLRISMSGLEWCMLLFTILCVVSYVISNPDGGTGRFKWFTTLFNLIFCPLGIYLVAKNSRYDAAKIRWLMWAMVWMGVYLAFTAVFEHYRIDTLVFPRYIVDPHVGIQFGRARGPMVGSNPMGEWLVAVYLAICLVIPFAKKATKVLLYGLIMVVIIAIYFTLTRGCWLSFAYVVILTSFLGGKFGTQSRIIVLLVAAAFFAGVGSKFSLSGDTLFSRRQNTIDYRMSNNQTTFNMGMANFFTGVGYGKFGANWEKYFGSAQKELTKDLTDGNHNIYLGLFADLGFPGVALYVTMFGFILKDCRRARRFMGRKSPFERNLALSAIGLVIILLWEGMSGDMRFNPTLNTLTFLFVGITASVETTARKARANQSGRIGQ